MQNFPEKWFIKGPLRSIIKEYNSLIKHECLGIWDLYYCYPAFNDIYSFTNSKHFLNNGYVEITIEQFKEHYMKKDNTATSERKLIGYELKERTQAAVSTIDFITNGILSGDLVNWNAYYKESKLDLTDRYEKQAMVLNKLREYNLLNLLLKPVYVEEKKRMTLKCVGGSFEVVVSKEGIYYEPENTWLPAEEIEAALKNIQVAGKYTFKPSHIDSGCKQQVPVEDWEKVINEYIKMQKS